MDAANMLVIDKCAETKASNGLNLGKCTNA